jgi:tetratricopeptide (TPR) repeat protein
MKSLIVKVVLPILLILLFSYASAQQKQIESRDQFHLNRGVTSHDKGQLDQAISDFTKALEINPRLAEAYYNRGIVYSEKGQLDQAISDFTKALEINPRLARPL